MIVDVLGTAVALRVPTSVLPELEAALVDFQRGSEPVRDFVAEEESDRHFRLIDTGVVVRRGIDPTLIVATIVWRLNQVAAERGHHLVMHAGCVADQSAVILPGQSGTGKSSLVAACITAGMAYLSDEYAVIDPANGIVLAYPKPVGLDSDQLVSASALRTGSVGTACSPGGMVFPRYEADAPSSATRLEPAWTLSALAAHTTNLASLGGTALTWLAGLAEGYPAWQVTYGTPAGVQTAIDTVAAISATPPVPAQPAEIVGPISSLTTTVALGDGCAVMHEPTGRVHVLNATASFVWMCAADEVDPTRLVDLAVLHAPDGSLDPTDATATVEYLRRCGLLPTA